MGQTIDLPDEEDDTKNVLDARQKDAHDGSESGTGLHRLAFGVSRAARDGRGVVGESIDGLRDVRPVLEVIL